MKLDKSLLEQFRKDGYSTRKIAELTGKSQTNVVHWLKKYGLSIAKPVEVKTYKCLNCGENRILKKNSNGKYCNSSCQQEYQYKTVLKPKIESGEYYSVSSKVLRKYLVDTRGYKCELCPVTHTWNNKPITLQVDHINGNSDDCSPENIRLLCPNCHSQTETFNNKGGSGKKDTKRNKMIRKYRSGN